MKVARHLLIIFGLFAYYLGVVWYSGFFADPEFYLLRLAPDSGQYLEVTNWLFNGVPTQMIQRRTFLFPLILGLVSWPAGPIGIWVFQMFLWVGSAYLFYLCTVKLVASFRLRAFLFVLFLGSWSNIYLSIMALTESLTMFFLALIAYVIVNRNISLNLRWCTIVVITGFLAGMKLNFAPMFYGVLAFVVLARATKRLAIDILPLLLVTAIAVTPAVGQRILTQRAAGTAASSDIGHHVLQVSLYSQVLAKIDGRKLVQVREEVAAQNPETGPMLRFLAQHPWTTVNSVRENLEENIRTVLHVNSPSNPVEHWIRRKLNAVIFWLHVLMIVPLLIVLTRALKMRKPDDADVVVFALVFLLAILPTGISFWAADRWTAPLVALWPLLYVMVANRLRSLRMPLRQI